MMNGQKKGMPLPHNNLWGRKNKVDVVNRKGTGSARRWLLRHYCRRDRYIRRYWKDPADWDEIDNSINHPSLKLKNYNGFYWDYPIVSKKILEDFKDSNEKKVEDIVNYIIKGKSKIIIINGGRGSGKTCLSMFLSNEIHKANEHIKITFIGEGLEQSAFPNWLRVYEDIENVKNAIAIVDEAAIKFSARRSMDDANVALTQLVAISRHQNLTIIFLTQHLKLIDINAWRMRSAVFYLMGVDSFVKNMDSKASFQKSELRMRLMMKPRRMGECLFDLSDKHRLFTFKFPEVDWWNDDISKIFKNYDPHKEMIKKRINKVKSIQQSKLDFIRKKEEIKAEVYAKAGITHITQPKTKEEDGFNPLD